MNYGAYAFSSSRSSARLSWTLLLVRAPPHAPSTVALRYSLACSIACGAVAALGAAANAGGLLKTGGPARGAGAADTALGKYPMSSSLSSSSSASRAGTFTAEVGAVEAGTGAAELKEKDSAAGAEASLCEGDGDGAGATDASVTRRSLLCSPPPLSVVDAPSRAGDKCSPVKAFVDAALVAAPLNSFDADVAAIDESI